MSQTRYDFLCAKFGAETTDNAIQERLDWEASKGKAAAKDYAAAASNWLSKASQFAKPVYANPNFIPYNPDTIEAEVMAMRKRRAEGGAL